MAYGSIADSMVSQWLQTMRNNAAYASVHFEVPNWTDPGASEAFSPGYSRQPVIWQVESARGICSAQPLVFPGLSAMTIAAVGLWTDLVSGTMVAYCTSAPGDEAYLATTSMWTLPAGELAVRL